MFPTSSQQTCSGADPLALSGTWGFMSPGYCIYIMYGHSMLLSRQLNFFDCGEAVHRCL